MTVSTRCSCAKTRRRGLHFLWAGGAFLVVRGVASAPQNFDTKIEYERAVTPMAEAHPIASDKLRGPEKTEMYIHLGLLNYVHYFLHTHYDAHTPEELAQMTGDVYNCMIHKEMIYSEEKLVVFHQAASGGKLRPIYANHAAFRTMKIPTEDLKGVYVRLMELDRSGIKKTMVITAVFKGSAPGHYVVSEVPNTMGDSGRIAPVGLLDAKKIALEDLTEVVSAKPFSKTPIGRDMTSQDLATALTRDDSANLAQWLTFHAKFTPC